MWAITNAGTHRLPLRDCGTCDIKGHMEGRLYGIIEAGELVNNQVFAAYNFIFHPSALSSSNISLTEHWKV
jgi:hypothetical protein